MMVLPKLNYLVNGISSTLVENYCGKVINGLTIVPISIMVLPKLNYLVNGISSTLAENYYVMNGLNLAIASVKVLL